MSVNLNKIPTYQTVLNIVSGIYNIYVNDGDSSVTRNNNRKYINETKY